MSDAKKREDRAVKQILNAMDESEEILSSKEGQHYSLFVADIVALDRLYSCEKWELITRCFMLGFIKGVRYQKKRGKKNGKGKI